MQLYFYVEPNHQKCFIEELPNDTVVVGHYMAEEWDKGQNQFVMHEDLGIKILIKVRTSEGPPACSSGD